jgi:hypothetical protein
MRYLKALLLAWYVVTYSGQIMAGPFTLVSDCNDVAEFMAERDGRISRVCRSM